MLNMTPSDWQDRKTSTLTRGMDTLHENINLPAYWELLLKEEKFFSV